MKQREKLRKCWQNDKTVSKFIHELEELYNMIGMVDERDKVIKHWDGLWAVIQRGLWRDELNPDISTWEDVRERAQIMELSKGVSDRFERRKKGVDNAPRPSTSNDSSSKAFNGKRSGSNNHGFSKPGTVVDAMVALTVCRNQVLVTKPKNVPQVEPTVGE